MAVVWKIICGIFGVAFLIWGWLVMFQVIDSPHLGATAAFALLAIAGVSFLAMSH